MNIFSILFIIFVISFILILIALLCIHKTFKLMVKSLYECNSNLNYIKGKIEKEDNQGKHQKLFEKED